jgi:hypothetical protein
VYFNYRMDVLSGLPVQTVAIPLHPVGYDAQFCAMV